MVALLLRRQTFEVPASKQIFRSIGAGTSWVISLKMATSCITKSCIKYLQLAQTLNGLALQGPNAAAAINHQIVRHRRTKHFTPKFKKLRNQKFVKVELPNFEEKFEELPRETIKSRMKEKGLLPPRPWMERPFYISCTGGIFEAYVPPEGDGKMSAISRAGAKQKFEFLEKKSKSMMAIRKVKNFDEDFSTDEFAQKSQEIYIQAHTEMSMKNKLKIREFVTERAYPEMMHNVKDKTIHWKFLKSLEPPRVVHARCTDVVSKDNIFGQITVRFHTQQQLAIYDRFGRLMHGSEILAKDVLEYVVFEKHLSNEYGIWRLHDKIVPDWLPAKQPAPITFRIDDESEPVKQIEAAEQSNLPEPKETPAMKSKETSTQ